MLPTNCRALRVKLLWPLTLDKLSQQITTNSHIIRIMLTNHNNNHNQQLI